MTAKSADAPRAAGSRWRLVATRRRRVVVLAALVAVVAGSLSFWLTGNGGSSGPVTTVIRNGEVWLQGPITQDTCDESETHIPVGDAGCSITVNGYEVGVVHGNALVRGKGGTVTGLNLSADQTGQHADIYAQIVAPHSASVLFAAKYYARISG